MRFDKKPKKIVTTPRPHIRPEVLAMPTMLQTVERMLSGHADAAREIPGTPANN